MKGRSQTESCFGLGPILTRIECLQYGSAEECINMLCMLHALHGVGCWIWRGGAIGALLNWRRLGQSCWWRTTLGRQGQLGQLPREEGSLRFDTGRIQKNDEKSKWQRMDFVNPIMRCKQNATNFIYFIQTHCYLFTKCILYLYIVNLDNPTYLYLRECLFKCGSTQGHTHVESVLWEKMMRKWLKNVSKFKKWNFGFSPRPQAHVFHQVFPKQHRFLITSCEQHIASKCDADQLRMLL